jgi:hypothetical protein
VGARRRTPPRAIYSRDDSGVTSCDRHQSLAMLSLNLNRRHKAGFFLVVVATGLSLFFEASAKQTVGIVLLGIAATWLVGAMSPQALGFVSCSLCCVIGLCMAILPILKVRDSCLAASADYDRAVAEFGGAVAEADVGAIERQNQISRYGFVLDRDVQIPALAQKWLRPETEWPRGNILLGISFPGAASESAILAEFKAMYLLPRPKYSLAAAIRSNRVPFFVGVALLTLGLVGFCGLWRWKRQESRTAFA